jgi:hypothetical protein
VLALVHRVKGMFKLFKKKPTGRAIYFHEDDFCQQQLLPARALEHVRSELRKINEFSEAHRSPDGLSWSDVYVRDESAELNTLKLTRGQFVEAVSNLPAFDTVYTGYSTHKKACKSTCAFGFDPQCSLIADWDDAEIIKSIWAQLFSQDSQHIEGIAKSVKALGAVEPLIYVDWAWGYVCDSQNEGEFITLLTDKLKQIQSRRKNEVKSKE